MTRSVRGALLIAATTVATAVLPVGLLSTPALGVSCPWMDASQSADVRAHELVAAMSIDNKVALTQGQGFVIHYGVANFTPANPSLCIPEMDYNDAGQGVGDGKVLTTAFPAPIAQASSWDPTVQRQFGAMLGSQAFNKGVNVQLAPGVEVDRVPTNGRNWEYMSEDPYLSGQTGAAVIEGIQSNPVVATVKHYIANSQETNRMTDSSDVSQRTLQEIYMPPYEAAIKQGHVGSVMCSYNRINSVYACENPTVLGWLKGQLGFDGWVMSDWGATHSTAPAANAGLDQEQNVIPGTFLGSALKAAVQGGQVPMSRLDDIAFRIVKTMFRVGLFDHHAPNPALSYLANVDNSAAATLARQIAEQGTVLLKNNTGVLPLPAGKRIAVIGTAAGPAGAELTYNGAGSGHIPEAGYKLVTNPLVGMEQAALQTGDVVTYADGSSMVDAAAVASLADVAVVFAFDQEGEGTDRPNLSLPSVGYTCTIVGVCTPKTPINQDALIRTVAAANPNTVVVLETGGPVLMPWLDQVKGLVEAWYPGQEQGNAIADVLFGKVNPSAKLTETFPAAENQVPASTVQQWPGVGTSPPHSTYSEGLEVGYRWYDAKGIQPLFPFGYGLSYTTFAYSNLKVSPAASSGGVATVAFDVTNTGQRAGAEIAQLYVGAPANNYAGEPMNQLRGYKKVSLEPGQTTGVSLAIDSRAVSYWSDAANGWTPEAGCHPILVGGSSRDIRLTHPGVDASLASCAASASTLALSTPGGTLPNTSLPAPKPALAILAALLIAATLTAGIRRAALHR